MAAQLGDATAYWSVVSQIIPVLALAFVLEMRALASRWQRRKKFGSPTKRVVIGLGATVLGLAMVSTEYNALRHIFDGPPTDRLDFALATVTIWLALIVLVSNPIIVIFSTSTSDVIFSLANKFPWSKGRRLSRKLDREILSTRASIRVIRGMRIEWLLDRARAQRMVDQVNDEDADAGSVSSDRAAWKAEAQIQLRSLDRRIELAAVTLRALHKVEKKFRKSRRQIDGMTNEKGIERIRREQRKALAQFK